MADMPEFVPPASDAVKGSLADVFERYETDSALDHDDMVFRRQLLRYGDAVRARRKALGWTQARLAREAGLKQPQISEIEGGSMRDGPRFRTMSQLADALDHDGLRALEQEPPKVALDPAVFDAPANVRAQIFAMVSQNLATATFGAALLGSAYLLVRRAQENPLGFSTEWIGDLRQVKETKYLIIDQVVERLGLTNPAGEDEAVERYLVLGEGGESETLIARRKAQAG
ncbi:helix-turn-helix domain-containing protein [Aestuariicoccus sp. MJ-SS9]|uniref:helix-turn-helix domain-containing protein n=1 Tax=Aestuariicoccus sp. MJ-SS9 TaxID=3079855 RepID=UPI0029133C7E|nr:helix-turn-helix domain-containing protein [Aestuariicoccus sp. MJ-SS9]MDU8911136.1 helix-turn-helix domain-containing protein [Aestuariicoccus sp. MJ-SS9]